MLKQIRMKEWRRRVSQPRILREITNQMFTQPDPSNPVASTPTYPSVTVHSVRSDTILLSILLNLKASLFPPCLEGKVGTRILPSTENAIPVVKHIGIVLITEQHKQKIQAGTLEIV
jgi:hypothetical protein